MHSNTEILFSIIVPTYNRSNLICKAINSVLDQTYSEWELIIVDDGSTDYTKEIIQSYEDKRIKYFYKIHEERSVARNFGIDKASGMYISFLDDDDYYLPEFLEYFFNSIKEQNLTGTLLMCGDINVKNGELVINKLPKRLIDNPVRLIWNYEPGVRTFVIPKDLLINNKFEKRYYLGEDLHLIMGLITKYEVKIIPEYLYHLVEHQNQSTHWKFRNNLKIHAENSISCLRDIIQNNPKINKYIPQNELFDKINHTIYGFSSAAMKLFDFDSFLKLIKEFSLKGSKIKLAYYYISLFIRLPYYYLISSF